MVQTLLDNSELPLVLRTDFSNDAVWQKVCAKISEPQTDLNFLANVEFLSERRYEGWGLSEVLSGTLPFGANYEKPAKGYNWAFLFLADAETITHPEHPLLVIDLLDERGKAFRCTPSAIQSIENNLSISNMDFEEFADCVEDDGIFRPEN